MHLPPVYSSHSCDYCDRFPQTWSLKTTHIDCLAVPEVRHPKPVSRPRSRCHRAAFHPEAPTETVFQPLQSHSVDAWCPSPSSENCLLSLLWSNLPLPPSYQDPYIQGLPRSPRTVQGKCTLKLRKTSLHSWCKKQETFPTATTLSLEYLSL